MHLYLRSPFPNPRSPYPFLLALLLVGGCADGARVAGELPERPNILFIAVDDLRPELGAYGKEHMHTPHMDRLADEGTVFTRAYVNVPVCGASRASLLSGMRPTRDRFVDYLSRVDEDAPSVATLPQHFRENGYTTASLGKIYHHVDDSPQSWSVPAWNPMADQTPGATNWRDYQISANREMDERGPRRGPPYESADLPDTAYFDGKIAGRAIGMLREFADQDAPFFLAVGFLKPHLPFNAPKRYWDLYEPTSIALADNPSLPENAPGQASHNWGELRAYAYVPPAPAPLPDSLARKLVHGYFAATSYADAMIGQVLGELDRLGLAENTIVVLWGDHGWQLGEHGLWCKHSPFTHAVHAPLIVRAPGLSSGKRTEGLVEFVDIYPTLVELAGLPQPADSLHGRSFMPQLRDPEAPGKEYVFPRWLGSESIGTDRYLYTQWRNDAGAVVAEMLYDHENDPEENVNVAVDPAYATVVAGLRARLKAQVESVER